MFGRPPPHGAAPAERVAAVIPKPEGLDTLEQAVPGMPAEPGPQDGPPVALESEQEAGTGEGVMNIQYIWRHRSTEMHVYDQGERSGLPRFSDEPHAANQHEKCRGNHQQQGRRRRDGANAEAFGRWTSGSAGSPQWSERPLAVTHWRDGAQLAGHVHQHARRPPTGLQQQNRPRMNHHHHHHHHLESLGYEQKRPDTALPANRNVTHWRRQLPCDIPLWSSEASSLQGQGNAAAITQQRSVRIAGPPPAPAGDGLYEDFLWKIMQLQVLHEHQHVDQLEADHILKALMGMRLPAEANQFLATQLGEIYPGNPSGPNEIMQSKIINSATEFNNNQQRYLLNVSQQGNYQGFDRASSNPNVAFPFVPQRISVSCSGNIGGVSPPYGQPLPLPVDWQQHQQVLRAANLPPVKCNHGVQGSRRSSSHTKEKQPGRKSVKENRAQYVYYLENQHKKNEQLTVQCEHNQRRWKQHAMTPFSTVQDANGNHQNSLYLVDQSHAVCTVQHQSGQSAHPHYTEQPGRQSGSGQQSPQSVTQSWSSGHDGTNDKRVLEPPPTLDNTSIVFEQNEVQAAPTPSGTDTAGQQTAADRDNGNAVPVQSAPDGRRQLPPISNTNQPVSMCVSFPQQGTPLHTPVFPMQYQAGPMNAPYLHPVNTPLFSPMQTPYFPTMPAGMPTYPQPNVFQYPSPLPYYPFGSLGQVGPPPNIFQFPDPAPGQQSMAMGDTQTAAQPQDTHYGFAGNHPMAQFPPAINANAAPFEPFQAHPGGVKDVNGNTVG